MQEVLVISDNESLVRHLMTLCVRRDIKEMANFTFCYSTVNKAPQSLMALGMSPVNVKTQSDELSRRYSLIISAHCKQIFPPELVTGVRCINVHPGFNPSNRGWYPQVFSIINKKQAGATIHLMTPEIDGGPILYRQAVEIYECDTSLDVYNRVVDVEKSLLDSHMPEILTGNYLPFTPESDGNYNSIADFRALCQLDLNSKATLREHLDLLRALSHGSFMNAYFIDASGKRVYVRVTLARDDASAAK